MARLIVKSPYISGSGVGDYLEYIGTREGVELLPSGYMEYMADARALTASSVTRTTWIWTPP